MFPSSVMSTDYPRVSHGSYVSKLKRSSMSLVDSGGDYSHCPVLFSRSTDFSSPLQVIANFGVRVYVSIVAGGSGTLSVLAKISRNLPDVSGLSRCSPRQFPTAGNPPAGLSPPVPGGNSTHAPILPCPKTAGFLGGSDDPASRSYQLVQWRMSPHAGSREEGRRQICSRPGLCNGGGGWKN
jgi:hypothetical protein